mgnify:CR=1 FL=1
MRSAPLSSKAIQCQRQATSHRIRYPPRMRKRGTVGVPMFNEVRIIDESGRMVGHGQQGEVVARGPSVFDGYLDDPHANAEAFVDGWFRTGDLGWFDDDGYLTLTGRIKDVINRGGEKIGALEVERVLADHPAVARVCVFGIPHPTLGEEVVASVIPAASTQASEDAIIAFARQRLAPLQGPSTNLLHDGLSNRRQRQDRQAAARPARCRFARGWKRRTGAARRGWRWPIAARSGGRSALVLGA